MKLLQISTASARSPELVRLGAVRGYRLEFLHVHLANLPIDIMLLQNLVKHALDFSLELFEKTYGVLFELGFGPLLCIQLRSLIHHRYITVVNLLWYYH